MYNVNVTSFPFRRWFCPFIIFYRYAEPFLRYEIVAPYFWLWITKTHSPLCYNTARRHMLLFRSPVWSSRSLWLINKPLFLVQYSYKGFYCKGVLLHIPTVDEKWEPRVKLWVKRSNLSVSVTIWLHFFFLTGYPNTSWSVFLPTL